MATCFDCGSLTGDEGKRRCSACEHWNLGMTRRIISAVKEGSSAVPEVFGTVTAEVAVETAGSDLVVDIDRTDITDRANTEVGEFNDFIVVI